MNNFFGAFVKDARLFLLAFLRALELNYLLIAGCRSLNIHILEAML